MNPSLVGQESETQELPAELSELQQAIDGLPVDAKLRLQPMLLRVIESTNRRRKILQMVQESIGQLRLDMKYLIFDLEATRRERDDLQKQVADMGDDLPGGEDQ